MRRKLVVGNWKMHGSHPANAELLAGIVAARPFAADVAVCVPFPYLAETAVALAGSDIRWGAQDCSAHEQGAYTGEVSAAMLAEFGCRYVIVGHSERRAYHGESDQLVADKAKAALARGVTPIVCVGETLAEREAGETEAVVKRQLSAVIHTLAPLRRARWSWPTSRCGPSAPAAPPRPSRRRRCTRCCARSCTRPRAHADDDEDPLRRQRQARQRRARCSRSPTSTAA